MLEVCHTIAICIDRNRMFANRLNVEYTLDLAVRSVERLNPVRNISPVIQAEFILYFARNFASFYAPGDIKNILDSGRNPGVKQGRNM